MAVKADQPTLAPARAFTCEMEKKNTAYITMFLGFNDLTLVRDFIWCRTQNQPSENPSVFCHVHWSLPFLGKADSVQEGEVAALFVTKCSWYTLAFRDTIRCTVVGGL